MLPTGRWTGITVVSPIPRWWRAFLRVNFRRIERGRRRRKQSRALLDLKRLAFIAFAHWGVLDTPEDVRSLKGAPRAYLLFQSNFNGSAEQYVEAFARVMPIAMRGLWGGAYGVPAPKPVTPFIEHILENRVVADHYYCAYPEASTKMVVAALALQPEADRLTREAAGMDAELFAREYSAFLTRVQRCI